MALPLLLIIYFTHTHIHAFFLTVYICSSFIRSFVRKFVQRHKLSTFLQLVYYVWSSQKGTTIWDIFVSMELVDYNRQFLCHTGIFICGQSSTYPMDFFLSKIVDERTIIIAVCEWCVDKSLIRKLEISYFHLTVAIVSNMFPWVFMGHIYTLHASTPHTHTHTLTLFHLALVNNPLIFTPTVSINMQHHTTLLFRIDWPLEEGWGCSCHTISIYTRPHAQRYETCLVPLYMFKTLTTWYMMIGGVYWIAWFILQFCMLWLWMWTKPSQISIWIRIFICPAHTVRHDADVDTMCTPHTHGMDKMEIHTSGLAAHLTSKWYGATPFYPTNSTNTCIQKFAWMVVWLFAFCVAS